MKVSTIFQLYIGAQFYRCRKLGVPGENHRPVASHWQTGKLYHIILYRVHFAMIGIRRTTFVSTVKRTSSFLMLKRKRKDNTKIKGQQNTTQKTIVLECCIRKKQTSFFLLLFWTKQIVFFQQISFKFLVLNWRVRLFIMCIVQVNLFCLKTPRKVKWFLSNVAQNG